MLNITITILLLIVTTGVSTQAHCKDGCKCKVFGYCYDCETGYYMQNETCQSCSLNCLSCSSQNKCEQCKNGYYNYKVNHQIKSCRRCLTGCTECTSETNCLQCDSKYFINGTGCTKCLPQCKTCKSENNCKTCIDGYILNGTLCQKCPEGYFKSDSSCLPCPERCASCSIINECTSCKQGFFGKTCDQRCSRGCDGNVCEQNMGNCTCKENYVGLDCNRCEHQKYGVDCNLDCPKRCLTCNSTESCTVFCNNGHGWRCYCPDECLSNTCDIITGQCRKCKPCVECVNGKWGNNCINDCPDGCISCLSDTNCTKCKDGFHDSDGQCLSCPKNCHNALCKGHNGSCDRGCTQGYWGTFCGELCPLNCLNGTCHKDNGTCGLGCKDGYHGSKCNCPSNCICNNTGLCLYSFLNLTGDNDSCSKHCYSLCLNCSQDIGKCNECGNNTFYRKFCDKECSNNCTYRSCDSFTETRTSGCMTGYFGDYCSQLFNDNCKNMREQFPNSLSQNIGCVILIVSVAILVIAIIMSIISAINSLKTKRQRHVTASLKESITYERESNSGEILACDRIVEHNPDWMQLNSPDRDIHNAVVLGGASSIACKPATLGNVYVNVEYASIDRNQFLYINEESEDEIQSEDNINEVVDDFIYVNTEEYLKRRVPVYQLYEFVKNKTEADYAEEFKKLPPGLIKPFHESQTEENMMKNRYKGVYPYDSRRVIVKNRKSDYINASYVDGYRRQKAYIASLGPTVKQMGADFGVFWNMVWQEKVCKIVMLTNLIEQGVKKCDKYWPDKDTCCTYEDVKVKCQSEEIYPYFTVRVFSVEKIEKRILYQMHFTAWPDKSTPKDVHGMLEFWEKLTRIPKFELGPIIVHCSAGVGRTGTFIALDVLAKEGVSEGTVDIYACVRNLREDRVSLIQTVEQYRFLHEALVQLLFSNTSVKVLLTNEENIQEKTLEETEQVTRR